MDDLRSLPKVDTLSRAPELGGFPERVRIEAARQAIDEIRRSLKEGRSVNGHSPVERALAKAESLASSSLLPAINLSGVVLHTGLGRARLAPAAVDQMRAVAGSHALLELDEESGKRGDRQTHVRSLLCDLTGAEDAFVVNNAAAAVVLCLSALSRNLDVILSRGQMVEIGGSFRMPDIVAESGCRLVEVGCTNKTRISDYEDAICDETGVILRCHTSNYKIIGFTEQPSITELVALGKEHFVPVMDDMGTGCIVDTASFGMSRVPTIQDSLRAGVDVVTASGDKLLGGPQAGLILGSAEYLRGIKTHPLARAMRVDKLTIAALEATLRLYSQGRETEIPTIAYLSRPQEEVCILAGKLSAAAKGSVVEQGITEIGGGSAPGTGVATWRVGLVGKAEPLAKSLRKKGIIGRIEDGRVWLDPRTLEEFEFETVCEVLKSL